MHNVREWLGELDPPIYDWRARSFPLREFDKGGKGVHQFPSP